ncbi:hypothetical protein SVI_1605 [Shewanella violacea DSS12]|uniref:Uncharacterized protein n=1 Tax=Shewanella violacea (strain JCM 10179 / CIP 106290 / LMG 19151 / DSS12) TaxID=637905 RepID=D4ZIS7_SHEVD|nr:hypothetical protein SVI_1605 [Shewanella violacea DSS12]
MSFPFANTYTNTNTKKGHWISPMLTDGAAGYSANNIGDYNEALNPFRIE